ncbi:flagellar basal body P-ring formation chaperone FlgA [Xenophilus sp.]|uniref:flagellar basal body P-ring formation chaperone FlgA n=1 Tax=Xenophilus sp. TaxID=1873499 RepID=UPI0037DC8409
MPRLRLLAVIALQAGAACAAQPPQAGTLARGTHARIELRPHVLARPGVVTLGDVADLTTRSLPLLKALMALPLGSAPRFGASVSVDREAVRDWVRRRAGAGIEWAGAAQTVVESAAQVVAGERVAAAAEQGLLQWLAARSTRAQVQPASHVRDLVLPPGPVALKVRPPAADAVPTERMQVWVEAWADGRFVRSAAVSFVVEAWADATVATSTLAQGAPLDAVVRHGAMEVRQVDIAKAGRQGGALALGRSDAPQRLRRGAKAGQTLAAADLEAAPAVARGQSASLDVRHGSVLVQSQVEVLQDGRVGDLVRVRTHAAQPLMARVVAPGQLEVGP